MYRSRSGSSRGGRGGGRGSAGRGGYSRDQGAPESVVELGSFLHAVEDEMFCLSIIIGKVPYFNAPVYLQNKTVIGKVDEILGPLNGVYFTVKMMGDGVIASSFRKGDKVYIEEDKLLPLERFLPKPKISGGITKRGRATHEGKNRGAGVRGYPRRGMGGGRGMQRGGRGRGQIKGSFRGGRPGGGGRGGYRRP